MSRYPRPPPWAMFNYTSLRSMLGDNFARCVKKLLYNALWSHCPYRTQRNSNRELTRLEEIPTSGRTPTVHQNGAPDLPWSLKNLISAPTDMDSRLRKTSDPAFSDRVVNEYGVGMGLPASFSLRHPFPSVGKPEDERYGSTNVRRISTGEYLFMPT
ncbi:hypothetical protein EV356DRAFT_503889 [Viridothelium virens]|uniref:Uncharacterized protein n=1 Tax=Viridothelium virens TaxID=1048519 RepID=A0A6A6H6Z0_VIRVR|nr:hypothetical protein EV356DRAFT_503889 [Viridothelium virens]